MNLLLQALLTSFDTEEKEGPSAALDPLTRAVDTAERAQYQQRRPASTIPPVSSPPNAQQMAT